MLGVVLHHGCRDGEAAESFEALEEGLSCLGPAAASVGNLEIQCPSNLGCGVSRRRIGSRTNESQWLATIAEDVVAVPVLPALGLAEDRDQVGARG
jgi:hypothetical protein